jgi:hypothetical protein
MKTKLLIVSALVCLMSCSSGTSQNQETTDSTALADTTVYPANLEASSFPDGEPVHETGILKSVEDGGYPFYTLEIEYPDLNKSETFSLNIEEVEGLDPQKLNKAKGKAIDFTFIIDISNALLDLREKNNSILGDTEVLLTPETKKVTGVLSGAENVTEGDLPGKITITPATGEPVDFEFFISPEIVVKNKKTLTAFYEQRTQNVITELEIKK